MNAFRRCSLTSQGVFGHFEHGAVGRLEEVDQTDLALNPGGRSPKTEPGLRGLQGLYDTAGGTSKRKTPKTDPIWWMFGVLQLTLYTYILFPVPVQYFQVLSHIS